MITISSSGNFRRTDAFLSAMSRRDIRSTLEAAGHTGVEALSSATPVDSGKTAGSWGFEVTTSKGSSSIAWINSHLNEGVPIAILLQFGHGTGTGGYVRGRDYINPAIKPIFDKIANDVWKAVTNA